MATYTRIEENKYGNKGGISQYLSCISYCLKEKTKVSADGR